MTAFTAVCAWLLPVGNICGVASTKLWHKACFWAGVGVHFLAGLVHVLVLLTWSPQLQLLCVYMPILVQPTMEPDCLMSSACT